MTFKYLAAVASLIALSITATPALAQDFPDKTVLPLELVNPDRAEPLSGADAAAVREAVIRVYLAEDARNREALEATVTDNFTQKHVLYGDLAGAEAFADFVLDNPLAFDRYRHMAMNVVTRAAGPNEAEALSYILVLDLHPSDEATATVLPRILAHGVVRDRLVREEDGWRIAHRVYDQFALAATVVPDSATRLNASQAIAD